MSRRKRRLKTATVNHERWVVSYADFITLLFAFFVVMYAISQVNQSKYRVLSEALSETFKAEAYVADQPERIELGEPPKPSLIEPTEPTEQASGGDDIAPDGNPADEPAADRFKTLGQEFKQLLKEQMDGEIVGLRGNEEWLEVDVKEGRLFNPASAELSNRGIVIFGRIAQLLKDDKFPVRVEGFTDNQPVTGSRFNSNWELSAARASAIVELFIEEGVKPFRLAAVGYGEYNAIASNATEQGRERNRRVVLMISKTGKLRPELPVQVSPKIDYTVKEQNGVNGVRLQNGEILFTSDPERAREPSAE